MTDQKRPTVTVTSGLVQSLVMHLYKPIDFGKGPVQARLIDEPVTLKPGSNAGIDKAFFEAWKAQNEHLTVMPLITALDEPESGEQTQGAASAAAGGASPMVDVDAMHRHVADLNRFKARAEKVLTAYEASTGGPGSADLGAMNDRLDQLQHRMGEAEEAVTALQQAKDTGAAANIAEQTLIRGDEAALGGRVGELERRLAGIDEVVVWFTQNREALEVLLTLGEAGGGASTAGPDLSGSTSTSTAGPDLAGAGGSMISGADQGTGLSPAAGGPGGPDVANMADAAARGGAGAPAAEVGSEAPAPDGASPGAALTAGEVMKDPTADPVKVGE